MIGDPKQVLRYSRWPDPSDAKSGPLAISSEASRRRRSYRLLSFTAGSDTDVFYDESNERLVAACMLCPMCGERREFECQVMPQILYYLGVDQQTRIHTDINLKTNTLPVIFRNAQDSDIDFGTIDVYTCPNSCSCTSQGGDSGAVVEELAFVIPPPAKDATRLPTQYNLDMYNKQRRS